MLYSIDLSARLSGLARREVVYYARHGFVAPVVDPSLIGWFFNADAIHRLRRIQQLRASHAMDLSGVRLVFTLMEENDRLRAELRATRGW
jgi:DNA-binding transcriptional MerR regulator